MPGDPGFRFCDLKDATEGRRAVHVQTLSISYRKMPCPVLLVTFFMSAHSPLSCSDAGEEMDSRLVDNLLRVMRV